MSGFKTSIHDAPPRTVPVPHFDPADYRVEWLGVIGSKYRLWWYDDGMLSGGETTGWQEVGDFDARDTEPHVAAVEHGSDLQ